MAIISLKGSNTYLLFAPRLRHPGATLKVEPAVQPRCGGLGSFGCGDCGRRCRSAHSLFSKCCISRM